MKRLNNILVSMQSTSLQKIIFVFQHRKGSLTRSHPRVFTLCCEIKSPILFVTFLEVAAAQELETLICERCEHILLVVLAYRSRHDHVLKCFAEDHFLKHFTSMGGDGI